MSKKHCWRLVGQHLEISRARLAQILASCPFKPGKWRQGFMLAKRTGMLINVDV